jgi:hypothetical protein
MVNHRISDDLKETALRLWELKDTICEALHVSERSCYRWRCIFEEFGTATKPPAPLTYRTRIIMRALLTDVEDLFVEDSELFLDEVCTWLVVQYNISECFE